MESKLENISKEDWRNHFMTLLEGEAIGQDEEPTQQFDILGYPKYVLESLIYVAVYRMSKIHPKNVVWTSYNKIIYRHF